MTIYETDSAKDFYRALLAKPSCVATMNAFADWLEEAGENESKAREVILSPVLSEYLPADYYGLGHGLGSGRGLGLGSGLGRGSGRGRGRGLGSGRGSGSGGVGLGRGVGRGSGRGSGRGRGRGSGKRKIKRVEIMEPGKCYLILTVDWYAWTGRCLRQIGPWEYEFECVSKFDTNKGDVFGEIAAGDAELREAASYQHFKTKAILGMGAVGKFEWVGRLPQEYDTKKKLFV